MLGIGPVPSKKACHCSSVRNTEFVDFFSSTCLSDEVTFFCLECSFITCLNLFKCYVRKEDEIKIANGFVFMYHEEWHCSVRPGD